MADRFIGNIKGKDAQQPNFSFVTPDTLPSGAQATIQNLGSPQNPVLKFGIPSGSQGAPGASVTGPKGDKGDTGSPGRDGTAATIDVYGTTLVDTDEEIRVENVGSDQRASLQFFLKRPPEEITIDEELTSDSTNPVQSKAIQEALDLKADSASIPTKVSELTNDRNFVSESSINIMIEDAVEAAAIAANPVDDELSDTSVNAIQNKVVNSALAEKVEMEITDAIDNNNTQYGEIVTLRNKDREVSMVLNGDNIESVVLSQNFAERIPTIVSELPTEGSLDRLYLVPSSGDNYSMHIWMDVDGVEKWVNIQSGDNVDLSGYATKSELSNYATTGSLSSYATKSELSGYATTSALNSYASKGDAIKNITRNGTTFTATRADNTTFTFTQQDNNTTYTLAQLVGSSPKGSETQGIYWDGSSFKTTQSLQNNQYSIVYRTLTKEVTYDKNIANAGSNYSFSDWKYNWDGYVSSVDYFNPSGSRFPLGIVKAIDMVTEYKDDGTERTYPEQIIITFFNNGMISVYGGLRTSKSVTIKHTITVTFAFYEEIV